MAKNRSGGRLLRASRRTTEWSAAESAAWRALADHLPHPLLRTDAQGVVLFANQRFGDWLRCAPGELVGRASAELWPADVAAAITAEDRRAVEGHPSAPQPITCLDRDPSAVSVIRVPVGASGDEAVGLYTLIVPLPDERQRWFEQQAAFLEMLLESVPDAIYFKDTKSRVLRASRFVAAKLGFDEPQKMLGKTDFDFFTDEHAARAFHDEQEIIRTGVAMVGMEEKETLPDGGVRWVSTTKAPMRDGTGRIIGTFGISRDITDRKLLEEQLARQAFYDGLTALPNRALFINRLDHLFRRNQRQAGRTLFAVVALDVDRFKSVNEGLGHAAGDQFLAQLARRLEGCVRPGDTLARLGDDEFCILLEDLRSPEDATRVAERIRERLSSPFEVAGAEVYASVSAGIALSSSGYQEAEEMLRAADTAMCRAKANGRARHEVFDAEMRQRAITRLTLETELHRALERNELVVHYQPIVRVADGQLIGFESLVRWQHPQRGLLPPAVFLPAAEESGLIARLSLEVMLQACRQMQRWRSLFAGDEPLRVSVNLSPQQLGDLSVIDRVQATLAETGVDPSALTVEITESALMQDVGVGATVIQQLRALGVHLYIDDFGTGYSSLSYLNTLAVDALKIDRSFVARMTDDTGSAEIVRAIVALAHTLGMKVIAEGVETAAQLEVLGRLRCDGAQGYFMSRPVPAAQAEALIRKGRLVER